MGEVVSAGIESVTYTLTYTGTPAAAAEPEHIPEQEVKPEPTPAVTPATDTEANSEHSAHSFNWLWIVCGALALLAVAFGIILIIVVRKRGAHEANYYETESERYEDQT